MVIRWLLVAALLIFAITGFGITEFRVVESLTFGLLSKSLAFKIHTAAGLWLTFFVLLLLHICLPFILRIKSKKRTPRAILN